MINGDLLLVYINSLVKNETGETRSFTKYSVTFNASVIFCECLKRGEFSQPRSEEENCPLCYARTAPSDLLGNYSFLFAISEGK